MDEALRLVPRDTAICVVIRDLRTHGENVSRSPFVRWLKESPVLTQFGDPADLQKLQDLEKFLADQFGATPAELLADVLGDVVVLAYQPGPPGQPDQETGVVLVRPRKPEVLLRIIGKVNVLQRLSGEVRAVEERNYRGRTYSTREKSTGGSEFYFLRDGTFAFSGSRQGIERVIDQELTAPPTTELLPPLATALRSLGVADRMVVGWFNPRGFDSELKTKLEAAKGVNESAFLSQFLTVWSATDGIALYAHPGTGLELGCIVSADLNRLPKEIRDLLTPAPGSSQLWSFVPGDAMFAAAGRVNLTRLLRAVSIFLPSEGRDGLKTALDQGLAPLVGRERLPRLLDAIGPDWGIWVSAPEAGTASWLPEWTVAVKLPDDADLRRSTTQIVDFGVHLLRIDYNRKHDDQIDLIEETRDGLNLKVLENHRAFLPGFRPTYAVKDGYLVIGGSPETVRRFKPASVARANQTPVARVAVHPLRDYLRANRGSLVEVAARDGKKPKSVIEQELTQFDSILGAFERVELRPVADGKTLRLVLQIDFVKPLK